MEGRHNFTTDRFSSVKNDCTNNECNKSTNSHGRPIVHAESTPSFSRWRGQSILRTPSLPLLVATRTCDEVPLLFRESHVRSGFRAPHQPWWYYALSFFQLHNESVNVWTHALASVLLCQRIYSEWHTLWSAGAWPMLAGFGCTLALYIASTCAHCFQSRSQLAHYTCFLIDYAAVGLYTFGSALLHSEYSAPVGVTRGALYLPLSASLAVLVCFGSALAKTRYSRPYPASRRLLQVVPIGAAYAVLIAPIVPRMLACTTRCDPVVWLHVRHVVWFLASAVAYVCELPQRWLPGRCDHFFHSHQLFHICIMLSSLTQTDAVLADFHATSRGALMRSSPGILESFGPVVLVVCAQACCVGFFYRLVKARLENEKEA